MDIQKLIQDEAERRNEQWQNEAQYYASEETKTYKENIKDLCFYERTFAYEYAVYVGFEQGANFALSLDRWVKVEIGMPLPELGQRILVCYKDTIGLDTYQTGIELLHATHYMTFDLPPSQ